jgi:hypothetical protein
MLVVDDPDGGSTTVSTTLDVNVTDPRWTARLVDEVTIRAQDGARHLREYLAAQPAIQAASEAQSTFVPLAAVVPAA